MNEHLEEAGEELKRLEHVIYVSLKYTRTVDVIINALNGLTNIYDIIIKAFMEKALEEGKITMIPKSPALIAKKLREIYAEDQILQNYMDFYAFLKMIIKLPHKKINEYRRKVALIVDLNNTTNEINIDNLTNCETYIRGFHRYARKVINGEVFEED